MIKLRVKPKDMMKSLIYRHNFRPFQFWKILFPMESKKD